MKDYPQLYGNNYSPVDPTPSYFNSSEEYLVVVHFAIAIVGSLGSLFIIYILWGKVRSIGDETNAGNNNKTATY